MRAKLGLLDEQPDDLALVNDLLAGMQTHGLDFTNTFRSLASRQTIDNDAPRFQIWLQRWKARLEQQAAPRERALAIMKKANPAVIPRNHQVEFALAAAVRNDDLAPFERLLAVLANPFEDTPGNEEFRLPPPPSERVYQTFCGT